MNLEMTHTFKGRSDHPSSSDEAMTTIIHLLRTRIAEIQFRRPEYSMRAFSKTLGLTATQFSEIINGKRTITRKIATRILDRLDVEPEMVTRLVEKLPAKQTRAKRAKARLEKQLKINPSAKPKKPVLNYIQLSTDEFRIVADWYYLA